MPASSGLRSSLRVERNFLLGFPKPLRHHGFRMHVRARGKFATFFGCPQHFFLKSRNHCRWPTRNVGGSRPSLLSNTSPFSGSVRCSVRLQPYFLLANSSCPSSLCCHAFDEFSKFIANVFRQNEFCFFLFNERQTIVNTLAFTLSPNLSQDVRTMFLWYVWIIQDVLRGIFVLQILLTVSFFSCFCFPPPFLSKRRRPRRQVFFSQSWFRF